MIITSKYQVKKYNVFFRNESVKKINNCNGQAIEQVKNLSFVGCELYLRYGRDWKIKSICLWNNKHENNNKTQKSAKLEMYKT